MLNHSFEEFPLTAEIDHYTSPKSSQTYVWWASRVVSTVNFIRKFSEIYLTPADIEMSREFFLCVRRKNIKYKILDLLSAVLRKIIYQTMSIYNKIQHSQMIAIQSLNAIESRSSG